MTRTFSHLSPALAACLALGCAAAPPPPPPPAPAPTVEPAAPPALVAPSSLLIAPNLTGLVARVDVRGAGSSEEAARAALAGLLGEPFDAARVQEGLRKLWSLGLFEDAKVEAEAHPSGVALIFAVTERPLIERVTFSGAKAIPEAELAGITAALTGKRADPAAIARVAQAIREHYVDAGYRHAKVETDSSRSGDGPVEVRMVIEEGAKVTIERWIWKGNRRVSEAELGKIMHTEKGTFNAPGGVLHADLLARDLLLISDYYYNHGMIQVRVSAPEMTYVSEGGPLRITVPIEEGPVFKVGKIEVADAAAGAKKPAGVVRTRAGEVFNRSKLRDDVERLRVWYEKELGRRVEVTPLTELDPKGAKIALSLKVESAR